MKVIGVDEYAMPRPVVLFIRSLAGLIFSSIWIGRSSKGIQVPKHPYLYLFRMLLTYPTMYGTYLFYQHLPLQTAVAIGFLEPAMQVGLAILCLGAVSRYSTWISIGIGYIGVLIMNYPIDATNLYYIAIALLVNLLAALLRIITKKIIENDSIQQTLLYGNLLLTLISAVLAYPYRHFQCTQIQAFLLSAICISGFLSQWAYMQAIKYAEFEFIAPMTYLRLLFALPVSYFIFDTYPTLFSLLGALLILISNYLLIKKKEQE